MYNEKKVFIVQYIIRLVYYVVYYYIFYIYTLQRIIISTRWKL